MISRSATPTLLTHRARRIVTNPRGPGIETEIPATGLGSGTTNPSRWIARTWKLWEVLLQVKLPIRATSANAIAIMANPMGRRGLHRRLVEIGTTDAVAGAGTE
jgi:hypothetical protein